MALGRLHPSDEYDIRIAVEEGEGGSLDGKWVAMLVDEIEHYSGEKARLTSLLAERDAEVKGLREALEAANGVMWMAEAYAEGGGSRGPEMRDYREAEELVSAALAARGGES